jgi:hypothetical protein
MKTLNPIRADIIALDAQDRPVLLIEVKGRPQENVYDRQQLVDDLREAGHVIPYAMLVTLEDIRIFQWDGAALSELLHLPTAEEPVTPRPDLHPCYRSFASSGTGIRREC